MEHFAEYKVPGGKLLSVRLESGKKIEKIRIFGDFFLHPEEAISKIENSLIGMEANASKEKISESISKTITNEKVELFGVTPEAIAHTIRMAIER
ncbi:MAG: lipoate protein ligase C-terminal domain-containing protein [Candidatus Micrarchaeales archaeon]|jgi:lipoate-protein ligase A